MHSEFYDVVYIGNYTKYYHLPGWHPLCRWRWRTLCRLCRRCGSGEKPAVTHLAAEDAYVVEDSKKAGVDCYPAFTPQSTLMNLHYPTTDPDIRTLTVGGVAGSLAANEVENIQMKAAAINSSLRGEVGLDSISKLRQRNILLAADVQGFIVVLREQDRRSEPWG